MTRKKGPPPSLFCEWVVGTTIPAALGPLPKNPPKQRDVVTVEVLTDDETEEDILKITYPRSSLSSQRKSVKDTSTKKVRFQDGPKKSALKKPAAPEDAAPEDAATDTEEDTSAESSDSAPAASEDESSPPKPKAKKPKEEDTKPSDSEDDSEPHITCKCTDCIRGRQKQQRRAKKCAKKAKDSDVPKDEPKDEKKTEQAKKQDNKEDNKDEKKNKEESSGSDVESQESESAKDTTDESDVEKDEKEKDEKDKDEKDKEDSKEQDQGKKKNKNKKKVKDKDQNDVDKASENEDNKDQQAQAETSPKKGKAEGKKRSKNAQKESSKENVEGPHLRRPNLIEPIRAEVVHTERAVETPEDPLPNAYYDAENNIVRIYHGPVYGHHNQSSYSRRDYPSIRPLPMGTPHPMQSPYYHGFDRGNDRMGGFEHVPITKGISMPAWNAYCPPGFAGYPGGFAQHTPAGYWPATEPNPPRARNNKGVFSMTGAGAAPPSSKDQDVAGMNNVFPQAGERNPYIPKRNQSQFSNFGGSNRAVSDGSPRKYKTNRQDEKRPSDLSRNQDWSGSSSQEAATPWDATAAGQENSWPAEQRDQNNGNNGQNEDWNNVAPNTDTWQDSGGGNGGGSGVDNGSGFNNQTDSTDNSNNGWTGDTQNIDGDGAAGQWDNNGQGNGPPVQGENNVMPGAWTSPSGPTHSWGDPTMAASTGGQVDATKW
ncbi:hypothetical protein QQS21_009792 [Conoideocrella luteorostrata]|uniref:Uncharacterized protein n=1 Tax=Conoideocrella luteorostrata TaxID=1105319 RepID=A0AAJ0CH90_9HYPO|nr:hypothetical protein QQS21_009792 [Conoideocrella luteorostrata]